MELVYFACIWMLASFVKSISGMGSGMFAAPSMLLFMDIQLVVPVICTLSILQSVGLAIQYRKEFHLNDILFVLICAIPGIFMGTYALKVLSSHGNFYGSVFDLLCYLEFYAHTKGESKKEHGYGRSLWLFFRIFWLNNSFCRPSACDLCFICRLEIRKSFGLFGLCFCSY